MKKIIVIKIGSAVLVDQRDFKIDREVFYNIVDQIAKTKRLGHSVVVVTSGAVAISGNGKYSKALNAAMGQPVLMGLYVDAFRSRGIKVCQLLFVHQDLDGKRHRYTKRLLLECVRAGVVPVINANDAVSSEELDALMRYADNDVLAERVALLIGADIVLMLTNQKGLIDFESREIVRVVEGREGFDMASRLVKEHKSSVGKGGMSSKIKVAENLCKQGVEVRIFPGRQEDAIIDSLLGKEVGTIFKAFKVKKRS